MVFYLDLKRALNALTKRYIQERIYHPPSTTLISRDIHEILLYESCHYLLDKVPHTNIIIPVTAITKPSGTNFNYEPKSFCNVYRNYVQIKSGLIVSQDIANLIGESEAPKYISQKTLHICMM